MIEMKTRTKTVLLVLSVVGLSGCAVYSPGYEPYGVGPAVVAPSVYLYGGSTYRYRDYDRGYSGAYPHQRPRSRHYDRDRDRDGVPDRVDRDRDGDGTPNRWDRRPGNPNYR